MREITVSELSKILKEHKRWIATGKKEGKKADLSHANLSRANLRFANLSESDLSSSVLDTDLTQVEYLEIFYFYKKSCRIFSAGVY